jgi:hypothetical protein
VIFNLYVLPKEWVLLISWNGVRGPLGVFSRNGVRVPLGVFSSNGMRGPLRVSSWNGVRGLLGVLFWNRVRDPLDSIGIALILKVRIKHMCETSSYLRKHSTEPLSCISV